MSDPESIKKAGVEARRLFGSVTMLINNAGIVHNMKFLDVPYHMAEKTLKVNTLGHIFTIKEFLPDMIKAKRGHIVSIGSLAAIANVNGMADYTASKAGSNAVDDSLRMELAEMGVSSFIKTTQVSPYYIDTGMFDGV